MPILCEFDTKTIRSPATPAPDTHKILQFSPSLVAPPRLAHGLREIDVDKNANIRVKSTIQYKTKDWVDCDITTYCDTTLYNAIANMFVILPANMQYLTGEHTRNLWLNPKDPASVRVNFERSFITPPKVVVFLNWIDLHHKHNWRLVTHATDVGIDGFTLNIETWSDTILYAAQACWVAYPEDEPHIFSMSVNTNDVRPWQRPQLQQNKKISFNNVEFFKDPTVFVALNAFDIDCNSNFRIKAYVDSVSRSDLVWHIDSWDDTVLYSAGASIIAFTN